MKVLILGTGIIGTIYGWAFQDAGVDVTHFVRKGKKELLKDGVRMDLLDERKGHPRFNKMLYQLHCTEEISGKDGFDIIIIPVNSYQVEEAIKIFYPTLKNPFFLIMAANWNGDDLIRKIIPDSRYALGYPDSGGTIRDSLYWTNLGPEIRLAEPTPENRPGVEKLAALFLEADIKPDFRENMLHWLWLHNASSIPMWIAFLQYKNIPAFLKDTKLLKQSHLATREILELCRERGIDIRKYPEVSAFKYPFWLFAMMFRILYKTNESMRRMTAHAAESSREAEENYRAVMRTAESLHFNMPVLKALGKKIGIEVTL